ncbi:MAG TPA: hypothetical protein VGO74_04455 [Modestobacter sp.]|nr:hypothetical protein [Modestobacter sp.]
MVLGVVYFLLTARVSSGEPTLGQEYVVLAIAAAVLGGTSSTGPRRRSAGWAPRSSPLGRALRVCEAPEAGMVGLNQGVISHPAAPFGG